MRFVNPALILTWCMTTSSVPLLNTVISLSYIGVALQKLEITLGPDSSFPRFEHRVYYENPRGISLVLITIESPYIV